jgi:hypothetical protein
VLENRLAPATLTVNSFADNTTADSSLTLREAILLVDNTGDASSALGRSLTSGEQAQITGTFGPPSIDTIQFDPGLNGQTIKLTGGELAITKVLNVTGPGASQLTVSGNGASRVFDVSAPLVSLSGLTIVNGKSADQGGGIFNSGTLTISDCTVSGNSSTLTPAPGTAEPVGGGIFNSGMLTVLRCTLTGNSTTAPGALGGGIGNAGAMTVADSTLSGNSASDGGGIDTFGMGTVVNSTLSGNPGGGIINESFSTLTVANSTLSGNSASEGPGGIDNGGTLTVADSTLSTNSGILGGGILNDGTLIVTNSIFSGNSGHLGGGILNNGPGAMATVSDSLFSGNTTDYSGGGIDNEFGETMTVRNSTLFNNSAPLGGGIENDGTLTVSDSTLSGNSASNAGGIDNFGTLHAENTILAGNTAFFGPDLAGGLSSLGHNLIGNTDGGSGFAASDLLNVNPLLAPLANYGGPTPTLALLPGSPAIDAGDNTAAPPADQRGFARIVHGTIDIGAFESRGFTLTVAGGNNQQAVVNTAFASPLRVTVSSPFGEPVQGGAVAFTGPAAGASATFPGGTATIDASGQASAAAAANTHAGSYSVTASAAGASPVSFSLTNTPGPATHFSVSGPTSVPSGTAFSLTVTALDAYGNVATGYLGTVETDASNGPDPLPGNYTFTDKDNGTHTFTGLKLHKRGMVTLTVFDNAHDTILGSITIDIT